MLQLQVQCLDQRVHKHRTDLKCDLTPVLELSTCDWISRDRYRVSTRPKSKSFHPPVSVFRARPLAWLQTDALVINHKHYVFL